METFRVHAQEKWIRPTYVEADSPEQAVAAVLQNRRQDAEDELHSTPPVFAGLLDPNTWVVESTFAETTAETALAMLAALRVSLALDGITDEQVAQLDEFFEGIRQHTEQVEDKDSSDSGLDSEDERI